MQAVLFCFWEKPEIAMKTNPDACLIQAIKWMEEYTGIDYPFGKFDIVVIPAFTYSGMEVSALMAETMAAMASSFWPRPLYAWANSLCA